MDTDCNLFAISVCESTYTYMHMNIQELWGISGGASSYEDELIYQVCVECPFQVIRAHPEYSQNITYHNINHCLPSLLLKQTVTSVSVGITSFLFTLCC